jgi:hypothetical protein
MATVRVERTFTAHGKRIKLKPAASPIVAGATAPAARHFQAVLEATAVQLRVLAEETRGLVVGRLYAAVPQRPGLPLLAAPVPPRAPSMPTVDRTPRNYISLTRHHVLKKLRLNMDGRFLIATGDYLDGIEVFKGKRPDGGPYYMVRLKKRMHFIAPGSGTTTPISLALLARVHEFGSRRWNIPPRPHWRPALKDVRARFLRLRKTIKADALRQSIRRVS